LKLQIRDARPCDAEAIVAILNPIIEAGVYTSFDTPFSAEYEREYILSFPKRGIFLVAVRESNGVLVGFQSMEPLASYTKAFDHVGVLGTYVDLDLRRQGVAGRLFDATFDAARQKHYEKIFTFIRADNPVALKVYTSRGFKVVGIAERHAKIDGCYIDEVIVEKFL
jgi:L-amino acid N-acyltransferase YncA